MNDREALDRAQQNKFNRLESAHEEAEQLAEDACLWWDHKVRDLNLTGAEDLDETGWPYEYRERLNVVDVDLDDDGRPDIDTLVEWYNEAHSGYYD